MSGSYTTCVIQPKGTIEVLGRYAEKGDAARAMRSAGRGAHIVKDGAVLEFHLRTDKSQQSAVNKAMREGRHPALAPASTEATAAPPAAPEPSPRPEPPPPEPAASAAAASVPEAKTKHSTRSASPELQADAVRALDVLVARHGSVFAAAKACGLNNSPLGALRRTGRCGETIASAVISAAAGESPALAPERPAHTTPRRSTRSASAEQSAEAKRAYAALLVEHGSAAAVARATGVAKSTITKLAQGGRIGALVAADLVAAAGTPRSAPKTEAARRLGPKRQKGQGQGRPSATSPASDLRLSDLANLAGLIDAHGGLDRFAADAALGRQVRAMVETVP